MQPGTSQEEQDPASPTCSSSRSTPAATRSSAARRCCRPSRRPASSTPAPTRSRSSCRGMLGQLRGQPPAEIDRYAAPGARRTARSTTPRRSGTARTSPSPGRTSTRPSGARRLQPIGDSILVVGDAAHDADPHPHRRSRAGHRPVRRHGRGVAPRHRRHGRAGRATAPRGSGGAGEPDRPRCGVVAVTPATAPGCTSARRAPRVVDGGPTMNPSTADILAAIHALAGRRGRRAAELAERRSWPPSAPPSSPRSPRLVIPTPLAGRGHVGPRRARPGRLRRRQRRRRRRAPGVALAPAASPPPPRTTRPADSARATPSATSATSSSPGANRDATARATLLARSADGAELVTCLVGADAPLDADGVRSLAPDGDRPRGLRRWPAGLVVAAGSRVSRLSTEALRPGAPRAFATGEPLDRGQLLRAPVRWPRPSRLEDARRRPRARRRRTRSRCSAPTRSAGCCSTCRAPRRSRRRSRTSRSVRARTIVV